MVFGVGQGILESFLPSSATEGAMLGKACPCKHRSSLLGSVQVAAHTGVPLASWMMVADGVQGSVAGGDNPEYGVGVGCLK